MTPRQPSPCIAIGRLAQLLGLAVCLIVGAPFAHAQEAAGSGLKPRWVFQTSLYTTHFNPDPRHVNHQRMLAFEHWSTESWTYGLSLQRNSFGQPTQYLFMGKIWRPFDSYPNLHLKLTGGLLHGYKGEFRDKIPFNKHGIAPGLVPSIGYSSKRFVAEVHLLGAAALMVSAGVIWE